MKKLSGILVLSLLLFNNIGYSKNFVKLPKDVGSGSKFYKSLTGKYYKNYGVQIVNKKDGHPVRSGKQSIRFEVKQGDCGKDKDGQWDDCKNDRERHELSGGEVAMSSGEYWFSWSIYFPKDHKNLYPLSNAFGQFHQKGGHPVFMFKELKKGYSLVRTITEDDSLYDFSDYDEKLLLTNEEVTGKWFDVLINAKWTKKKKWFF